jgi:glycerol kinase
VKHVLAIDEGTTGVTCLVIGENGRVVGRGYREIPQHFPQPGWVEHDLAEILDATIGAARGAIAAANVIPNAVGITNQRETVAIWERATGRPVGRAIVWQDRRTASRCAELRSTGKATLIAARTGLVPDPYFSATKVEYLLQRERLLDRYRPAQLALGTIDCWLVWQLTGGAVHATEPTNASRTMLFDIDRLKWDAELCDLFGVPPELLPEVRPSSGDFGVTDRALLGAEMPITGIAGDQQAALFGQGCWRSGEGKNTYGTGAFLLLNTGKERPRIDNVAEGLLTTVGCAADGSPAFALEGSIFVAGAAVQWLRDGLGIVENAAETEALARSLASNDGVYFVPALVGLGAPDWEPRARGTIVGLTRGTGRAHFARAALESMAYASGDVLGRMRECAGVPFTRLRVDGGATQNDWLMQFQADVLGVPVERPDMVETTALGAAGLAGLAAGIWPNADAFLAKRDFKVFEPQSDAGEMEPLITGWRRAVRATLSWARDDGGAVR